MNHTDIIITNTLDTGTAFAVVADNMQETVFVPSRVMQGKNLQPGSRASAMLVPNHTRPDKTPWLAVSIVGNEDTQAPSQRVSLERLILDDLEQGDASAEEIARSIKMPLESVRAKLIEMSDAGRIVRMETFGIVEAD